MTRTLLSILAASSVLAAPAFPAVLKERILDVRPGVEEPDPVLRRAIELVESGGRAKAVGDGGKAVGILQIHPVVVDDVNRILGETKYGLQDRTSVVKSREMFWVYTQHYSKDASREVIARRWNGGPKGDKKEATAAYWRKVEAEIQKLDAGARRRVCGNPR